MGITYEPGGADPGRPTRSAVRSPGRSLGRAAPVAGVAGENTARLTRRGPVRFAVARFAVALIKELNEDDVTGMSAEMAYRFLFAIFPLFLLSAAIAGLAGALLGRADLVRALVDQARPFLPSAIAAPTEGIARELVARAPTYALLGLIAALWGAASGIGALIKGLNRAYDVERPRSTWRRQAIAVAATLIVPPAGLALLLVSILGHSLLTWLGDALGIADLAGVIAILQALAVAAVFFVGISLVYRLLPAMEQRARDVVPGAMFATASWLVMTQAFGAYVANLDGYRATYGAFAAAVAFLLWLYLVSAVVLLGAEINALLLPPGRRRWGDQTDVQDGDERSERGARHG
ncbi:MAG: YihY/virulence factor BrkB family protein [Chloroflexi bacterium]|nr:YihY/virulence factor BrkB family protein [Chloroflexota bacterium]